MFSFFIRFAVQTDCICRCYQIDWEFDLLLVVIVIICEGQKIPNGDKNHENWSHAKWTKRNEKNATSNKIWKHQMMDLCVNRQFFFRDKMSSADAICRVYLFRIDSVEQQMREEREKYEAWKSLLSSAHCLLNDLSHKPINTRGKVFQQYTRATHIINRFANFGWCSNKLLLSSSALAASLLHACQRWNTSLANRDQWPRAAKLIFIFVLLFKCRRTRTQWKEYIGSIKNIERKRKQIKINNGK